MNNSQRRISIVFLAAVITVLAGRFLSGAMFSIVVLIILAALILGFVKVVRNLPNGPRPIHSSLRKLALLCLVAAVGNFLIIEFVDFKSRRFAIFHQAVDALQTSSDAANLLGSPIRITWPVRQYGSLSQDSGETQLSIPVAGTKSRGNLSVVAGTISGKWTITHLELTKDGANTKVELNGTASQTGN